jgi:hypothetical protein
MNISELDKPAKDSIMKYEKAKRLQELLSFLAALDKYMGTSYGEIKISTSTIGSCSATSLKFQQQDAVPLFNAIKKIITGMAENLSKKLK